LPRLHPVAVRIQSEYRGQIAPAELRRIARRVMRRESVAQNVGVEVMLADTETVRDLNRLYRGRDEPTDVLSFASAEGEAFVAAPDEPSSLGEIAVCWPLAESQAAATSRNADGEVAHLLVHGILHLLGYDHEERAEGEVMKGREDEHLAALGYSGQYEHGH